MIALTTSRKPSRNVRAFARELSYSIPNISRFNRGKLSSSEIIERLFDSNANRLVLVHGQKGNIGKIELFKLCGDELGASFLVIHLADVKLRRQHSSRKKFVAQAITFEEDTDKNSLKLVNVISQFLGLIKSSLNEEKCRVSFHFSRLPNHKIKAALTSPPGKNDVGLSFIIKHFVWSSGT